MKINFFSIAFFFCLISLNNSLFSQSQNSDGRRYDIESAFIKYKISGNTKGLESLKFDSFGQREISDLDAIRELVFYSVKNIQKIKTKTILNRDSLIAIDLKNKTGVKTLSKNFVNSNRFTKEEILKNDGKIISTGTVLNKKCDVWKTKNLEIWLWKGIALKLKSNITGKKFTKEATEINENIKIEENEFILPPDIKITDYTSAPHKK